MSLYPHAEICQTIILIWNQEPCSLEIDQQSVYLIIEGKVEEKLKASNCESGNFEITYELQRRDFFIAIASDFSTRSKEHSKKCQLVTKKKTLVAKISQNIFNDLFKAKIEQKERKILNFLKKVEFFEELPQSLVAQLWKHIRQVQFKANKQIFSRSIENQFLFFVKSGEVELRTYHSSKKGQESLIKSQRYDRKIQKVIVKSPEIFGVDKFNSQTYDSVEVDSEAFAKTKCLLYKIDKKIFAFVVSSFDLSLQKNNNKCKSVDLNEQIQGYKKAPEMEILSKNAERIKTAEKRIRDIKLRVFESSQRNRGSIAIINMQANSNDAPELQELKYTSCQNFHSTRSIKTPQPFYQTFYKNDNQYQNRQNGYQNSLQKMNSIVLGVFEDDLAETQKKSKKFDQFQFSPVTKGMKRRNSDQMICLRKNQESDMIQSFLEKKLRNQLVHKASSILQLNIDKRIKEKSKIKRIYQTKSVRAFSSQQPIKSKQIGHQLYERMNKINENPLLSVIESERKRMERQKNLMKQRSQKNKKIKIKEGMEVSKAKQLIVIDNRQ